MFCASMARDTQYYEVAEIVCIYVRLISTWLITKCFEWNNVMDIKYLAVFLFGFATIFTAMIGTFSCRTFLRAPIGTAVIRCSAIPTWRILSSLMFRKPNTHAVDTTKGEIASHLALGLSYYLTTYLTRPGEILNRCTAPLRDYLACAAMAHFGSTSCTSSAANLFATSSTNPWPCSPSKPLTWLATHRTPIGQWGTAINAQLGRFFLLRHGLNDITFCRISQCQP